MVIKNNTFVKNIIYAFLSQAISLCLSILTSLILPKFLGVTEYSYFQLFLFYAAYVGFILFGINDGIYLRLGGKKSNELDRELLGGQLVLAMAIQFAIIFVIVIFIFCFADNEIERTFILLSVLFYSVFQNISGYIGYIFQAINETKLFSKSILIEKVFFSIFLVLLLVFKIKRTYLYVVVYIVAKIIACAYCLCKGRHLIIINHLVWKDIFKEYKINVSVGINLMFANIASMLILGIARQFIDFRWGIESFGKFSFLLSIVNFFLLFIGQVSMVLFPQLRLSSDTLQKKIYIRIRKYTLLFSPIVFITFYPIVQIIGIWLPKYADSLHYLIYLLPLCIFETKTSLLSNTFFKVYRLERKILFINIISFTISLFFSVLGTLVFNSMEIIIIGVVVSLGFRSIISELILSSYFDYHVIIYIAYDLFMICLFIVTSILFKGWQGTIVFTIGYLITLFIAKMYRKEIV